MNIIGIIPARMSSTRFPGKPLAEIRGAAMIYHVYRRSAMAKTLNGLYLATCDKEIEAFCRRNGMNVIMTKATHVRASDRATEAMIKVEKQTGKKADIVAMIQGDEPMLFPGMIDDAVRALAKDKKAAAVNLMSILRSKKEQEDPNAVKVVTDRNGYAIYFSREPVPSERMSKREVLRYRQIAIIPFRRSSLLLFNRLRQTPLEITESVDMLRFLESGYKVRMIETSHDIQCVDTPKDLIRVRRLMKRDPLVRRYGKDTGRRAR